MSRWRCNSCGGTYSDVLPDGILYFHACPPDRVGAGGERIPIANPRDENIRPGVTIAIQSGGPTRVMGPDGQVIDADPDHPPIIREGEGRTLLVP